MQWQREECKEDSVWMDGWMEKNGDWDSEDVSDIKKPIHTSVYNHYFA
jgi:hypothetical protein